MFVHFFYVLYGILTSLLMHLRENINESGKTSGLILFIFSVIDQNTPFYF